MLGKLERPLPAHGRLYEAKKVAEEEEGQSPVAVHQCAVDCDRHELSRPAEIGGAP